MARRYGANGHFVRSPTNNPYISRKKVISRPLVVLFLVVLSALWLVLNLSFTRHHVQTETQEAIKQQQQQQPQPQQLQQHHQQQQQHHYHQHQEDQQEEQQEEEEEEEENQQQQEKQERQQQQQQQQQEQYNHQQKIYKKQQHNHKNADNKGGNHTQQEKQKEDSRKNNNKPDAKDKHDYRTIKIETPPPKEKKKHKGEPSIADRVKNLTETNHVYKGREKLVGMLLEMYIDVTQVEDEIWQQVPVWSDIVQYHGRKPIIHGLDTCEAYRKAVPAVDRHVAVAGMFNSGTNLLSILLQHNCVIPEGVKKYGRMKGHGMEWQVPWGKHTPPWYRGQFHVKNFLGRIPEDNIMPAVMVRHAHDWMISMCRHGYTAKWKHNAKNCPNLYEGNLVTARFGPGPSNHSSLAGMWNDWNGGYYNASFPRLMLRFEDTIFFPKETSRLVCNCVGGKLVTPKEKDGLFHYVIDSAKTGPGHGPGKKRNGLLDGWIKYGKPRDFSKFSKSDLKFADEHINRDIMEALHWKFPDIKGR